MKQPLSWLLLALAAMLIASNLFFMKKIGEIENKVLTESKPETAITNEKADKTAHEDEHILIASMQRFQWFGNKLFFAGSAENWDLANFYTHELEEVAEEVIKSNITDDGANISALMGELAVPKIEAVEKAVKQKDKKAFLENYKLLINTCNTCHQAAGKPFIKIKEPEKPASEMQEF
jgi:hypothetical protein